MERSRAEFERAKFAAGMSAPALVEARPRQTLLVRGRARVGKRLSPEGTSRAFPGMMDDEHGNAISTLQFAQIGEQRRDLAAGVLVDAVQAHEGIEDEQAWLQSRQSARLLR